MLRDVVGEWTMLPSEQQRRPHLAAAETVDGDHDVDVVEKGGKGLGFCGCHAMRWDVPIEIWWL